MSAPKPLKWTADCDGAKLLDSMFKSGALTQGSKPKPTWENNPTFKKYPVETFRTHLYKIKKKFGGAIVPHVPTPHTSHEDSDEELLENLSANLTPGKRKCDSESDRKEEDMSPYNNYVLSTWPHPTSGKKYTDGFILLPTGINNNSQYAINVSESCKQLVVQIIWPRILSSQDSLMKIAQLSDPEICGVHPMLCGITECFKKIKETVNDDVSMRFSIDLPHIVNSNIVFLKCIAPKDKTGLALGMLVHVRVEGVTDNFANMVRDSGRIETILL